MQQCVSSQQVCANFRFWFTLPRSILYTFLFSFSMNMKTKHLTFFLFLVNCLLLFHLPTYEGRFVQPAKLHIDTVAQTVPLRKAYRFTKRNASAGIFSVSVDFIHFAGKFLRQYANKSETPVLGQQLRVSRVKKTERQAVMWMFEG